MRTSDWTVADVAALLREQADAGGGCCVLIGAGASRTAGIGTGADYVALIRERHPQAYARAGRHCPERAPDYGECMGQLTEAQRTRMHREQIESAKINWAHIGIARLELGGHVDRILTTNFDPLASRACALFNRFPAVYDLAALRDGEGAGAGARFIPAFVKGSAVYHLHGQYSGFLLLNTEELLERQAQRIEPALVEAVNGRTLIICGYSGENDPLVARLAAMGAFPQGLVWVRHDEADPCKAVCETLLDRFGDCHVVRSISADRFFTDLANALDLPQPQFLTNPFAHMTSVLEGLRPFSDLAEQSVDLIVQARKLLTDAEAAKAEASPHQDELAKMMAEARYDEVYARFGKDAASRSDAERELIAWAAIMLGNREGDLAKRSRGAEASTRFDAAIALYAAAETIDPDQSAIYIGWAAALDDRGQQESDDTEACRLFDAAIAMCDRAIALSAKEANAFNNRGNALSDKAERLPEPEASRLFALSFEDYDRALAIDPAFATVLNNKANGLLKLAVRAPTPERREALLAQAEQGLLQAEKLAAGTSSYNLACIAGLRGDPAGAAEWLRKSHAAGKDFPGCAHLLKDGDFRLVREDPAFAAAVAEIGCG